MGFNLQELRVPENWRIACWRDRYSGRTRHSRTSVVARPYSGEPSARQNRKRSWLGRCARLSLDRKSSAVERPSRTYSAIPDQDHRTPAVAAVPADWLLYVGTKGYTWCSCQGIGVRHPYSLPHGRGERRTMARNRGRCMGYTSQTNEGRQRA